MDVLIEEAAKKAAVAWVRVDGGPALLVWTAWIDGALYVVTGDGEQAVPGLATAGTSEVSLRGDHGGLIITWEATVTVVDPAGETWATVAPQLAAKRLNGTGTTDEVVARWAASCVLLRLAPYGTTVALPSESRAAPPPRPTPAVRLHRKPFRLHRVRRP
jgi:hypothetical protein